MTVLATYNLKGGVGKTASAVNLAWLAAEDGLRTLLWDLDPQGAATFYFRVKPKVRGGAKGLVRGRHDALDAVRGSDHDNLDILPADFRYRHMDRVLHDGPDGKKARRRQLAEVLDPLRDAYDLILLDCPPSLSLTSENVFDVADALLVPLIPTTLSVRTLEQLLDFRRQRGLALSVWPFFTMVDRRKKLHVDLLEALPRQLADVVDPEAGWLSTVVPTASEVERMGITRQPLGAFAPGTPAFAAYRSLWSEVRGRLGWGPSPWDEAVSDATAR